MFAELPSLRIYSIPIRGEKQYTLTVEEAAQYIQSHTRVRNKYKQGGIVDLVIQSHTRGKTD